MQRGLRVSTVALAAAGVLAACGGSAGNPTGSSEPTSTASQAQSQTAAGTQTGKAPRVSSPLQTDGLVANACSALSPSQMTDLGIAPPGKPSNDSAGPSCQWSGAASPSNAAFAFALTANKNGLDDIYAGNDQKKYAYFEPVQVDGYPGVYAETADNRPNGNCSLLIGATDQLVIGTSVQLGSGPNKAHPCDSANKIATAMIQHLKGAA